MNQIIDRASGLIDADREWIRDLEHVFKYGNRVSPRGMLVYESLALQSVVSMSNPIIFNPMRKLGYKFMAAEAAWILGGQSDVATIAKYSKEISKFSDDGVSFFGAYGPKINDQFIYVLDTLMADPNSRQAVVNIWRENPPPTKDVPCSLSLQVLIRHDTVHCVATMRSSDLWLGHPYDIFNYSAFAFAVLLDLNSHRKKADLPLLRLGNLHLTAGSKHIYERNAADVGMIIEDYNEKGLPFVDRNPCFVPERYDDSAEFVTHLWDAAESKGGAFSLLST
jgi:thymidylate synthase